MVEKGNKIILFINPRSPNAEETKKEFEKLLEALGGDQAHEIVDVYKNIDWAEENKIEVLPTLLVYNRRFSGVFKAQDILKMIQHKRKVA